MSLKAQLRAAVARCTPIPMQHATFQGGTATANATDLQQQGASPLTAEKTSATVHATDPQQQGNTDATGVKSCTLHLHRDATRNFTDWYARGWIWTEEEIKRFTLRKAAFMAQGLSDASAEELADLLVRRDRQEDDRRLCHECNSYEWGRCQTPQAADVAAHLGELARMLQRCPAFVERNP